MAENTSQGGGKAKREQREQLLWTAVGIACLGLLFCFLILWRSSWMEEYSTYCWLTVITLMVAYSMLYLWWSGHVHMHYFIGRKGGEYIENMGKLMAQRMLPMIICFVVLNAIIMIILLYIFFYPFNPQYIYLEDFSLVKDRLFFNLLVEIYIAAIFGYCVVLWMNYNEILKRGSSREDFDIINLKSNTALALIAFLTVGPYLFPLLVEYILINTGQPSQWHIPFWQKGVLTIALFIHCLSLVQINRRATASILQSVVASILVLILVGIYFGFIYFAEDKGNFYFAKVSDTTEVMLPGFKDYQQPTPDMFKAVKYRIRESDLIESLEQALNHKVSLDDSFNEVLKNSYSTIDSLVAEIHGVVIKKYAGLLAAEALKGESQENFFAFFSRRLTERIRSVVAMRGHQFTETDYSLNNTAAEEWRNVKLLGYYIIPYASGDSEIKVDYSGGQPIECVFENKRIEEKKIMTRENFLDDLRRRLMATGAPHIQVIGVADSTPLRQGNIKFSSNYELARARAERARSLIRSELESCPVEAEISVASISNDYSSATSIPALQEMMPESTRRLLQNKALRASFVVLTETSSFKPEVIKQDAFLHDPRHYSAAITLIDSMFYSIYTVTTTGYGIIPLSGSIKFFTSFENIFELLIVVVLLGVVIGRPKDCIEEPRRLHNSGPYVDIVSKLRKYLMMRGG